MKLELHTPAIDIFETEMNRLRDGSAWDVVREKLHVAVEQVIREQGPAWLATAELDAVKKQLASYESEAADLRRRIAELESAPQRWIVL